MQKEKVESELPSRFMLIVRGNGMEKAGIKDGAFVTCEKTDTAVDDDIVYAGVMMEGKETLSLSRYRKVDGEIRLYSETDDKTYLPFTVAFPTNLKIYGKVVRCTNMIDEFREGGRYGLRT